MVLSLFRSRSSSSAVQKLTAQGPARISEPHSVIQALQRVLASGDSVCANYSLPRNLLEKTQKLLCLILLSQTSHPACFLCVCVKHKRFLYGLLSLQFPEEEFQRYAMPRTRSSQGRDARDSGRWEGTQSRFHYSCHLFKAGCATGLSSSLDVKINFNGFILINYMLIV